jgi:uncharacterized protein (TIGR02246 family)
VDKEKKNPRSSGVPSDAPMADSQVDEFFRTLQPETRRPKPSSEAIAAALEAAQRLAAEADAEQAADDTAQDLTGDAAAIVCRVCGYRNHEGNKFCGMCGITISEAEIADSDFGLQQERPKPRTAALPANLFSDREAEPEPRPMLRRSQAPETHHYHHHYHHHYFPGGQEVMGSRPMADSMREEKLRPTAALRGDMSRAEAAVRRITQEWVLACNTKHLDDLLDLYVPDALVLRSNYPPIRGAAAVREFFFGALDAGLGEVEVEPLRVEVVGDFAYEAGRCKALIPSSTGKRREERGKYLWVCAKQSNGEWKLTADCWSSDLTLTTLESDVPQSTGVRTGQPRKSP